MSENSSENGSKPVSSKVAETKFKSRPPRIKSPDQLKKSIQDVKARRELDEHMPNLKPTPKKEIKEEHVEKIINKLGGKVPETNAPTSAEQKAPSVPPQKESIPVASPVAQPAEAKPQPLKEKPLTPEQDVQRTVQIGRFKNALKSQENEAPVKTTPPEEIKARIKAREQRDIAKQKEREMAEKEEKYGLPDKGTDVPIPSQTVPPKPVWPKQSAPQVTVSAQPKSEPQKGLFSKLWSKIAGK